MQGELAPNAAESEELEVISILIEAYEKEHYTKDTANASEAILFKVDQLGLPRSELGRLLGSRIRANELLAGSRKLSIGMIRKLNEHLGVSAQTLIQEYEVVER